jgi:hypothetical protein
MKDLENLTMEDLHGILTGYEMRIEQGNSTRASRKEATFKVSKKQSSTFNFLFIDRSWVSLYFCVFCYIFVFVLFCSKHNPNLWYQSCLLLFISHSRSSTRSGYRDLGFEVASLEDKFSC